MILAKVGGSLLEWPELGTRLFQWIQSVGEQVLLVAGGGRMADVIREMDRIHSLEPASAHWLAVRAMSLNGQLLAAMLDPSVTLVDPFAFLQQHPLPLPQDWSVTSDSIAAGIAIEMGAKQFVLLKSCPPPSDDPVDWPAAGYVDEWLPRVIAQTGLPVRAIDFPREFA